jgi:hypothetical protein
LRIPYFTKIDLNNISNEERDELKRLSKGNLQPFSQVVNEFRSRRNGNQSRNNSFAGTPTAIQADGVDIGTGGDSRTDGGRDTGIGFENEREEIKCITKAVNWPIC